MRYQLTPSDFAKLKRNNAIAAFLYFLIGSFIFIGSFTIGAVSSYKPNLVFEYIIRVRIGLVNPPTYQLQYRFIELISQIPVMLIIGVILLISVAIHFMIVTKKINPYYNKDIQNGVNKFRGIDGVFSSVLIALLPLFVGINNFSIIILLFALSIMFHLSVMGMEHAASNQKKPTWAPFIGMIIAFLASGAAVIFSILKEMKEAATLTPTPLESNFHSISRTLFIVYFAFWFVKLVHLFLQNKRVGKWKNPVFVENIHMLLNFTSKIAIVAMIFYGLVNGLFPTITI